MSERPLVTCERERGSMPSATRLPTPPSGLEDLSSQ